MCLEKIKKQFIAEEHIIVHKHFEQVDRKNAISSYQYYKYDYNKLYKLKENIKVTNFLGNECSIDHESSRIFTAFHSYLNDGDAIYNAYNEPALICIIPKGSECYLGDFNGESVASNKIIITNVYSNELQSFLNNVNLDKYFKENNIIV